MKTGKGGVSRKGDMTMQHAVIHYPNLKTVLMVEETLKKANALLTREELKTRLPTKVMHQTLNIILGYLEDSGKIMDERKGILWIYNPSTQLDEAITEGVQLCELQRKTYKSTYNWQS